ncbi:MAG: hypothetical protein ACRD0A_09985 [Acidimicrobiales bacterium]
MVGLVEADLEALGVEHGEPALRVGVLDEADGDLASVHGGVGRCLGRRRCGRIGRIDDLGLVVPTGEQDGAGHHERMTLGLFG